MRRLCIGDIHGCYDKLIDVLDRCRFSDTDILYSVGDFTDRGKQNVKTLDFLMELNNFKPVCGNHDLWNYEYLHPAKPWTYTSPIDKKTKSGVSPYISREAEECWIRWNGGRNTEKEESAQSDEWKEKVYLWLKDIPYRINLGDKIIIHSVCPSSAYKYIDDVDSITMETLKSSNLIKDDIYDDFVWNRGVINGCKDYHQLGLKKPSYDEYFRNIYGKEFVGTPIYIIGHTPLDHPFFDKEMGIIGIDTGAFCYKEGWGVDGYLTVLDIDTFEYWQSDKEGSFQL